MIQRGVDTTLRVLVTDEDGAAVSDSPTVTVTITKDSDGSEVATDAATSEETAGEGVYTYSLSAVDTLDRLTAVWTSDSGDEFTTVEEIVGGRMCSLDQITEDLPTANLPSADRLRRARDIAEVLLEDECGVAWRPRYAHEKLDGSGTTDLLLPTPQATSLRSASVGGTALTSSELADVEVYPEGVLYRATNWTEGRRNVDAIWEHGYESTPGHAVRVAALLARHIATKRLSNLDDRASTYSTDEATYSLITPGIRGAMTALPEVNAFINSHQFGLVR